MNDVAIVILNFNGEGYLKKFLPILINFTPSECQIIVADNNSSDNSISLISSDFPSIKIISLTKNYGYAEGYNQAFKQINAKYYVLINSDVEVTKNWLPPLLNQLKKQNIAACQPKILSYHNKTQFEYAGAAGGFIDKLGYPFCRGRIINNIEEDKGQYDDCVKIFWATGACLAISSNVFHEVGGFDGDFFAHMEEIDLCWRIQLAGFDIVYTSESIVYHIGGGTLSKSNSFKTYLNFRNGLSMIFKNLPTNKFYWRILQRLFFDGIASLGYLAKGQFNDFWAVVKAHFVFYWQLKSLRRKRKFVKSISKTNIQLLNMVEKSLLFEYFKNSSLKFSDLNFTPKK